MVVTVRFTIRETSLPRWNKQGIKIYDWFLAYYCGVKLLEYSMRKFETSQKDESRSQSADPSKAYRKPSRAGLHNWERWKGQIFNIYLPRATKVYFYSMWRFRCGMEETSERQLLKRGWAFATIVTIEKALAGRKKCFRGPHAARGPYVVQACSRAFNCSLFACFLLFQTGKNRMQLNNRVKRCGVNNQNRCQKVLNRGLKFSQRDLTFWKFDNIFTDL